MSFTQFENTVKTSGLSLAVHYARLQGICLANVQLWVARIYHAK